MSVFLNYILTLGLFLFILSILKSYKQSNSEKPNRLIFEKSMIYLMWFLGHGILIFEEGITLNNMKILVVSFILVVVYLAGSELIGFLEPVVWHVVGMLNLIGTIILHRLNIELGIKQSIYGILGFFIMAFVGLFVKKFKYLDKLTWLYISLSIGFLLLANSTANGATNWFVYKGITFQPSEFVKIFFAFFLAGVFKKSYNFFQLVLGSFLSAVVILILVYQRDLGSALLFFSLYMVLSYMYSRKRWISFLQLIALASGGVVAYELFGHVKTRVLAWMDPFTYIDNQGFQITQSLFAFSNGKWFGTGLNQGMPDKIPVVSTDFIFAAIGEEFGSVFSILLILLYLVLIILLFSQCQKTNDLFKAYVGVGITVMLGFQGFLIIGGVLKFIPMTGVTFPFVSYGGTSLVSSVLMVGIIEGITKSKNKSEEKEYRSHTIITLKRIMLVLYISLMGYLIYFLAFESESVQLNSYNNRLATIEKNIIRGTFYDKDGVVLAKTNKTKEGQVREYPYNEMFAHVIGYSQVGKTGLEATMNIDLLNSHENIFQQFERVIMGYEQKGSDIYLTLDYELQKIAFDALEGKKGAVIAIEPSTGKILAMVSKPDFDPNQIESIYTDLIDDKENATLLNRATNGLYAPGSTFKILTALEYVEENGKDFYYYCKGVDIFANKYIHCYQDRAHGRVDIESAFAHSCNTAFATMGESISMKKLEKLSNTLLFNQVLPYDYNHVSSSFVLPESISGELRAETVIGQGQTLISPLHNLMIVSAIANGGILMKPYLVNEVINEHGSIITKNLPKEAYTLLETGQTRFLKDLMAAVVESGTGKGLQSDVYQAAGKTGAAENSLGATHAWFVGFAPLENPEIAVAIIVENAGSSSSNSVPIAKLLFDYYLIERD